MSDPIQKIETIEARNARVETDKAWETSYTGRGFITLVTYGIAVWFMYSIDVTNPAWNALVPTGGYVLSTLTMPWIKKRWVKKYKK